MVRDGHSRSERRRAARPALERVLGVLVLVGYAASFGSAPADHGWSLWIHLLKDHHGVADPHTPVPAAPDVPVRAVALGLPSDGPVQGRGPATRAAKKPHAVGHSASTHDAMRAHDEAHGHTHEAEHKHEHAHRHAHPHVAAHDHAVAHDEPDADAPEAGHPEVLPARSEPHEHDGRMHTHEPLSDDGPALLTLALDKHCLFGAPSAPLPPPAPDADLASARGLHAQSAPSVESPPLG